MIEKKIIRFDKGMNEYSIYKELDSPDKIVNYENIKGGQLQIRKQASEWNKHLSSSASAINDLENIFVWYPDNMPASASGNECIFLYGSSSNILRMFYGEEDASNWKHEDIDVVDYQASSELRFFAGTDKLLIADGNNIAHYVKINHEGDVIQGKLGVKRPTKYATASSYEERSNWENDDWEESNEEESIAECGLFQYTYTIETEDGDESNPAPLSKTIDRQYFNQASDGSQLRWVDRILLKNLQLPSGLDEDFLDRIEAFNIYRRETKYSAAGDACNLYKVAQTGINSKYNSSNEPYTNNYVDVNSLSLTTPVNYDNNVAPIAADVCEVGGHIVLSDVQTKMEFPYNFQYYCPIKIQNKDSRNFIDGVIRMRLYGSECNAASDPIDNLSWDDFFANDVSALSNADFIRFYDTDINTPLPVVWSSEETQASEMRYLDVFVKVPNMLPNTTHKIYLAWTNNEVSASGITDSWYKNASYGEFVDIDSDTSQQVFNSIRVKDENTKICSPTNERDWSSFNNISNILPNKADTSKSASLMSGAVWYVGAWALKKLRLIGTHDISVVGESQVVSCGVTDYIKYNFGHETMEDKFVFYSWIELYELSASGLIFKYVDSNNGANNNIYMVLQPTAESSSASSHIRINMKSESSGSEYDTEVYIANTANKRYFIGLSCDFDNDKLTVFVKDVETEYSDMNEVGINTSKPVISASARVEFGNTAAAYDDAIQYVAMPFMEKDNYINEKNKWQQLSNIMPELDEMIGYNYDDETQNNLINFGDVKEIQYERMDNTIRWSKANRMSFPNTSLRSVVGEILRSMPAPSFLPFKYENTILIYTRNRIYRFVLKEDTSWVTGADIVIPEIRRLGLLAPNSLVETQSSLFWLSEVGVVRWSPDGMELISKNIIDVTVDNYE